MAAGGHRISAKVKEELIDIYRYAEMGIGVVDTSETIAPEDKIKLKRNFSKIMGIVMKLGVME